MLQNGTVVAVNDKNGKASVEVKRQTICEGCHKQGGCGKCSQILRVEIENRLNAKCGDTVTLETDSKSVIIAAAVVFVLPIVIAIATYFIAGLCGGSSPVQSLSALAAFILAFAVIAVVVRVKNIKMQIVMKDITAKAEEPSDISAD